MLTAPGGNDVFVDIGDKSWGVRVCQQYFGGIDPSKTLHIGDQFLSAGANDFKVCHGIWMFLRSEVNWVCRLVWRLQRPGLPVPQRPSSCWTSWSWSARRSYSGRYSIIDFGFTMHQSETDGKAKLFMLNAIWKSKTITPEPDGPGSCKPGAVACHHTNVRIHRSHSRHRPSAGLARRKLRKGFRGGWGKVSELVVQGDPGTDGMDWTVFGSEEAKQKHSINILILSKWGHL